MSNYNKSTNADLARVLEFARNKAVVSHQEATFTFYESVTFDDGSQVIVRPGDSVSKTIFFIREKDGKGSKNDDK